MTTLDEVYRKYGEVSEAAQLLETELGTLLLAAKCLEADLFRKKDVEVAREIYRKVNKQTLGQLLKTLNVKAPEITVLEQQLKDALAARNRLAHSFYMRHNLRRNSVEGCTIMLKDLEEMHEILLGAYKEVMLLSGCDLDKMVSKSELHIQPTKHLPI